MNPANAFHITKDRKVYIDQVEIPFPTEIELRIEPCEPIEILLRTFAWKIVIESDDATCGQTYPAPDEACSEFRVTKDGRALLDGIELPGICGYGVEANPFGDLELVLRILAKTLDVESLSLMATDGKADSSKECLSQGSGHALTRRRLFSWLPFPRKRSLYR